MGAERAILEARYFLVNLNVPSGTLSSTNNHESYHGVTGTFCPLDWHLQKSNPSTVAMFRDLVASSHHCQQHSVDVSIEKIVKEARHYDAHAQSAPHCLEIGGLVFHETRCGSTLTANLLSAADPAAHRVYSEASPLLSALLACNTKSSCSHEKHDALMKDVLYLMGRSSDPREKRVFYKIQSVGVRDIASLTEVIPNVPWIFIYRNSVEVIMSHFKDASISNKAVCLRGKSRPHPLIMEIAESHGKDATSLSNAEYCAAHLVRNNDMIVWWDYHQSHSPFFFYHQASLCEAAIREHAANDNGRFVNYADLPDILWENILPNYFNIPLNSIHYKEMQKAAEVYSKGRGAKANKAWQEDSTIKQDRVSSEIKEAAQEFLEPTFEKLEELAHEPR